MYNEESNEELEWIQNRKWLNSKQCSIYTGLSIHTIRGKVQSKDIPFSRLRNSHILRFERNQIDRWIRDGGQKWL